MTSPTDNTPNIGLDYLTNIYQNTTIETKDPQPIYILHRDTIRTFLHEKVNLLGIEARTLGLLGVEVSLIAALATATFHDFWFLKANVICAAFFLAFLGIGGLLARSSVAWWRTREDRSVDALTDQLGYRGSEIKPKSPTDQL